MAGDITRRASIVFDADTSRAQTQIQSLASALQGAVNYGFESSGFKTLDQQLQSATKDAIQLQTQLQAAVNVNTGKLDLTKFNQSLKTSHTTLQQYQQSLSKLGTSGQAAFSSLAQSIVSAEVPMQRVSMTLDKLLVSLKNTITWNISSNVINGFVSSISQAFTYAEKLNESLNRIQIVTGESNAQMAKFAEQANKSAQALSTTTRKYTDAALIFYQQGLGDADVKARTDAVIKMANVTGDASKEVSNYMTAIWNNFDNGTSSLESFEDKIVSLGATTASSSAEIAAGLEKFAAVGNTIGLSFDYAAAALATVVAETRQSADTVGTSFRTLFSRLQGLKLGETLEDGTTLNKYSAALATVGVQIQDTSGQLKNMDTILTDLAGNWDNLTQAQKVALAQTVGGARQYTTLISLMENWDQFQQNLATEANSNGALNKQAETYAQSWEAAKAQVTAAAEGIYQALIDDQFFINVNKSIAGLLQGVNTFIQGLGGVKGVLSTLGALSLTVFEKQISASLRNLTTNLSLMTKTGQSQMMALKQQAVELSEAMTKNLGNGSGTNIIQQAYESQVKAQLQLIQNNDKLTDQERSMAALAQSRIANSAQELIGLGEQINKLEELQSISNKALDYSMNGVIKMFDGTAVEQEVNRAIAAINVFRSDIDGLQEERDKLSGLLDNIGDTGTIEQKTQIIKDAIKSIPDEASPELLRLRTELQDALNEGIDENKLTELRESIVITMEEIDNKTAEVFETIRERIRTLMAESPDDSALQAAGNRMLNVFNRLEEQITKTNAAKDSAATASRNMANAEGVLANILGTTSARILTTTEAVVKFGQILTSITSIINQVKGLLEVWNDDSKTTGEKILALVSTVGMLAPLLVRVVKNMAEIGVSGAAAAAGTGAFGASAGAATGPTVGFGTALATATWQLTLIAAAIAAVIIIVKSLSDAFNNAKPQSIRTMVDEYEDYKQAAANLRSELEATKSEAQSIQEQFDNYGSVVEQLENCTTGTDEWYQKLIAVRQAQADIIANNPDMMEWITQNGYNTADYKDQYGIWDFSKLMPLYQAHLSNKEMALAIGADATARGATVREAQATEMAAANQRMANIRNNTAGDFLSNLGAEFSNDTDSRRITFDLSTLKMDTGAAAFLSAFGGTSPTHWENVADYDERMRLLSAMDYGVGSSIFTSAAYHPIGENNSNFDINALTTESNAVSGAQIANGLYAAIIQTGFDTAASTWDDAKQAFLDKYGEDLVTDMLLSPFGVDSIDGLFELFVPEETRNSIPTNYNEAFTQAQFNAQSNRTAIDFAANLTPEILHAFNDNVIAQLGGPLGLAVTDAVQAQLSDITIDDTAISEFTAHLAEADEAIVGLEHDATEDLYYGVNESGERITNGYLPEEVLYNSSKWISGFENLDLVSIIQGLIDQTIPAAQKYIEEGNFDSYTLRDLGALNSGENAATIEQRRGMAAIYGEQWQTQGMYAGARDEAVNLMTKYGLGLQPETGITVGQLKQIEGFDNSKVQQYFQDIISSGNLTGNQLEELLNVDLTQGTASIAAFQAKLQELGLTTADLGGNWDDFIAGVEESAPVLSKQAQAWGNVSDANKASLSTLASGKTISGTARDALEAAGFDISGLQSYQGKYKIKTDATDPLGIQATLDEVYALQTSGSTSITEQNSAGTNFINRNNKQRDKIAQALGYENYDAYSSAMLDAAFNNPNLVDTMSEKLSALKPEDITDYIDVDNYDFNALYEIAAQFGTMWRDTLEKIDKGLADEYAPLMAQRQAEIEGLTLSSVELKSIKDLKSMDAVLNGRRTVTKASTLAGLYGKQDWAATDFMTAQQYEGLNITEDMDYSQRQAAIEAYMETLEVGGPYAAELAAYLQQIKDTEFSEAKESLTQLVSQLQTIQTLLDNFNLTDLASNSAEAWDILTKKIGLTRQEFSKLSKVDQIKQLGQAQRANLNDTLTAQRELATRYETDYGFNGYADAATLESYRDQGFFDEYQNYLSVLQQIATTKQNIVSSQTNEDQSIIETNIANVEAEIAALQAANTESQKIIDNYSTASSTLVDAISTGALTAIQRLQIAGTESGTEILAAWDAATSSAERAMIAAQMTAKYTEASLQQQSDTMAYIREASSWINKGQDSNTKVSDSFAFKSTQDLESILATSGISVGAKSQIIEADKKVRSQLTSESTLTDYYALMREQLSTMSDEANLAFDQIKATGSTTLSGIFTSLGEEARTEAQAAAEAWLSAFETIADARSKLLSGGNLLEDLAGDPVKLLTLARGTATDGDIAGQMQRIVQGTMNGTLSASDLSSTLSFQDYQQKQLAAYNLNLRDGRFGTQSIGADRRSMAEEVMGLTYDAANNSYYKMQNGERVDVTRDELNDALEASYAKLLEANGTEAEAAKARAHEIVTTGKGYKEIQQASEHMTAAIEATTGLYQINAKRKEDEAAITAAGDATKQSTGGHTYDQWTKLQEAISKGQIAAKTSTDQSSWEQQMIASGYGDALQQLADAGIGFNNVNTAAASCASALAALTAAAAQAAQAEAKKRGYTKNTEGKWQKDYSSNGVTKDQLQEEYGAGWESVANTLTAVTDDAGNVIKYTGVYVDEGLTESLTEIDNKAQAAQTSLDQIQYQRLSDAAAALGESVGTLDTYVQSIAMAEGTTQSMKDTWGDWNGMSLDTQTMLAEAAVEYSKSLKAIEAISDATKLFDAIDKEAGTDATALKEKAAAYRELAEAVNNYFVDGLVDAQFIKDNEQLIKDWANGSIEAMEQLESKIHDIILAQNELSYADLGITQEQLNSWANGLKYGEALNDEQVEFIRNVYDSAKAMGKSDAEARKLVDDLADASGVTLEWEDTIIDIPKDLKAIRKLVDNITSEGKTVKDQAADIAALMAASTDAFEGYNDAATAAEGKTAAIADAWNAAIASGADASSLWDEVAANINPEAVQLQVEADTGEAEAQIATLTGQEAMAFIQFLADTGQIDSINWDDEGVIHYSAESNIQMEQIEADGEVSGTSTDTMSVTVTDPLTGQSHTGTGTSTMETDGTTKATFLAPQGTGGPKGGTGNRGGGGGGGRRGGRGGGGGGGGGRRQDYTGDKKRKEQRYVTNTNQLEDLQHILEKINKTEERTYGRNRIKQMQEKAKALEDVAKKQKDLYKEAVKYAAQDKKDLQSNDLAKKMGLKFEFDENGTILNRDAIEQKMVDYYNSFTNGRNEKGEYILKDNSEAGEAKFKMMQEDYAELEKLLDKYDESQDKIKEYWEAYMDSINEAYDVIVEMANYKVEVQVEVSDEAVKLLDHMLTKIEDDAYKAAEAISYMGQQAFEYQAQDKINNKGIHDILAHHDGKSKYFDSEGKEHTTTKFTESDIQGILNGNSKAWDKLMGMEKEFTQDELDSLQEMINSKIEATEKLMETQKQVYEQIGVVFDEATDKMERQMNRIEHLQNITDSYANITDLVGRKKLGMTNEMLNELDLAKVDQSLSKLRGAKELMDTQKNMMGTLQNQFYQGEDGKWYNNLQAKYKDENGKEISREKYWKQQAKALKEQGITGQASAKDIKADKAALKELKSDKKTQDAAYNKEIKDLEARKKQLEKQQKAAEAEEKKSSPTSKLPTTIAGIKGIPSAALQQLYKNGNISNIWMKLQKQTSESGSDQKKQDNGKSKKIAAELKNVEEQLTKTKKAQEEYDATQQKAIDNAQAKVDQDQQEATLMQEKLALYEKLAKSDSVELTERDIGLLTDQMENMEDAIQESTENFYSSWEEAIEKISELYTNMIGRAIEDASDKLAGKLGSLDELADRFAKSQELDQRYVEDYEKIYEFSKLNRDIINSIDETDNVKAKQALAEYQKEINQLEEDETEISKYQIENARRRYELLLAQLALEEARDAKSQVQMTRSSTGEWSYVYTADESQVAEAEQNYEDKLFAMQQANAEYINELQQNIIDLQQRMMEEIQQLRVEDYASYEEYMEAVNAIKEHYGVLMDYNMEQLGIVFDEQTRLYDEDWTKYSEATGYKISTDENYLNKWNETALAKQTGFDTMEEMHENFNKTSDELLEKSSEAYQTWSGLIDTAMIDAGTSTDDFATKLNTDVGQMNADAAEAAAAMEALGDAAEDAFSRMTEALSNWQAEYSAAIEDMLEKNEALAKSFNELLKAWSGYNDTVGQDPGDEGGGDEDTPTGGDDPTGGETPTGGDSKGSGYAVIDKGYRYYIYEEDGSNTGKSDVHWGFGSKSKDRTYNLSRKIHAGGKDLYELADHPGKFLSGPSASHKHIYWNEGGRRGTHIYEPSRRRRRRSSRRRSYTPRRSSSSRGSDLRDRGYPSSTEGYRPRSGGGCFEAGTQILMADLTTKNIEDIKINDMVMAYNEELMTYEPCAVIESYTHHNTPALMEVYLNDGSVIKMTPAHPILTIEGWKSRDVNMSLWEHRMSVDYLTLEDKIVGHNGFYSIVEIREYTLPENYDTYNLAIEKCHTFIADNIVVHNTVSKYASGGYTGDWGTSDGRIAILHEKEIVLNKEDTANFLTGIGILRDITKAIDLNALASAGYLANLGAAGTVSTGTLEQEVHITAEFPNATDKESIKEAFNDLINLASQYAGRM